MFIFSLPNIHKKYVQIQKYTPYPKHTSGILQHNNVMAIAIIETVVWLSALIGVQYSTLKLHKVIWKTI